MKELCPQGKNLQLDDSPQSFWYTQIFSGKKRIYFKENFGILHGYLLRSSKRRGLSFLSFTSLVICLDWKVRICL